jgi:hypothetical protein
MPYQITKKRSSRKSRQVINIHQNRFPKAYISTIDRSRRPVDSLSDMTNMELVQDNVVRPRPPLVRYGTQPALAIVGRGEYRYNGVRGLLWMLNDSGVGKIYKQIDGGVFTLLGGTYDVNSWSKFCQSKGKVYISNGVNKLSYLNLATDAVVTYTALTTPSSPIVAKTGMAGTDIRHYYRISANNAVGESIASVAGSTTSLKLRDSWIENTDYMTVTWTAVTDATSYTVYYGTSATTTKELFTVDGATTTTFTDYGTLAVNPFKLAPEGNSTDGFTPVWLYNDSRNSQIFGIATDNKLYYSAAGTGDFSPYDGGGWVEINADGDTQLNFVDGFRNGKGDPVITVSARGAGGKGKLFHATFEDLTVGDQIITFPSVFEANGQSGTYAPRATVKARDSLYYFTGQDVRSTGTSQNIVNILTTATISQVLEPDLEQITLDALDQAVGVEYRDKIYFSLPVGSDTNNEIWCLDLSRKNAWILRWPVAAKDLWLYEDSDGATHFCALVDDVILEFTRAGSQTHHDDNVPWRSRVAFEALVWDEDGITLGQIRNMFFKLLQPKGTITANSTGLTRIGISQASGSDTYTVTTTFTGIGQWDYSGNYMYGDDPGVVNSFGKSVVVLEIKPRGQLNQLAWEVVAEDMGCDYILSAVNTRGMVDTNQILRVN